MPSNLKQRILAYDRSDFRNLMDSKNFIDELPTNLRVEISYIMHQEIVLHLDFLKDKPKAFIAFLGPLLKPIKVNQNDIVFSEGDPADESKVST